MKRDIEFLIVGGGIAGLRAAIELASAGRVAILTKSEPDESNTGYAQGGIAAAVGDDDSAALHAADTIRAGDGLCDEEAVRVLVEDGPRYVRELLEWGARFDRDDEGRPALGREAAHSVRRVLHAGDATGREIGRTLWQRVSELSSVETINHALVTELLVEGSRVAGVAFFDSSGTRREFRAAATLLATGGAGQVFSETTNPSVATGDGISLAYHAGARVADLEFIQFHPTALKLPAAPRFLISEALRGEGARLVNSRGESFMTRYHAGGDLAPRDVVARSIVREEDGTGGGVFLTLAHLDATFVARRFPTIAAMCRRIGLDLAHDPIPVGPAAHYIMGGVETDEWGRTSLTGLFAAGEVACTGVHGANRLASNSLLEGLVFGARAGIAMTQPAAAAGMGKADRVDARALKPRIDGGPTPSGARPAGSEALPVTIEDVRRLMWQSAGLFRTGDGLASAVTRLSAVGLTAVETSARSLDSWRRLHLLTVARLIAQAALRRQESRGGHFRDDFPDRDDRHWKIHVVDRREDS
ncbi:MAG TPA: L-aspartate oxidase [Vicinamibacterales bacterium]|nr:L-aspartate oxidase [Vicinamibacterales bacterium]